MPLQVRWPESPEEWALWGKSPDELAPYQVQENPFFRGAFYRPLIAFEDGQVCGRLTAWHRGYPAEQQVIGLQDFEASEERVAVALLQEATHWGREHGATEWIGPLEALRSFDPWPQLPSASPLTEWLRGQGGEILERWVVPGFELLTREVGSAVQGRAEKARIQSALKIIPLGPSSVDERVHPEFLLALGVLPEAALGLSWKLAWRAGLLDSESLWTSSGLLHWLRQKVSRARPSSLRSLVLKATWADEPAGVACLVEDRPGQARLAWLRTAAAYRDFSIRESLLVEAVDTARSWGASVLALPPVPAERAMTASLWTELGAEPIEERVVLRGSIASGKIRIPL